MDIIRKTTEKKTLSALSHIMLSLCWIMYLTFEYVYGRSFPLTTITQFNWFVLYSICTVRFCIGHESVGSAVGLSFSARIKIDWLIADFDFSLFGYTSTTHGAPQWTCGTLIERCRPFHLKRPQFNLAGFCYHCCCSGFICVVYVCLCQFEALV